MKKWLLTIFTALCTLMMTLGIAACNEDPPPELDPHITFNTLTVSGTDVSGTVGVDEDEFDFNDEITAHDGATFAVSSDAYGQNTYLSKVVPLPVKENVFYVFEMDGEEVQKTYKVTLTRPIATTWSDLYTATIIGSDAIITGVTDLARQYYTTLTVPATVDGATVKAVGEESFKGYTGLKTITFPEGILTIGNGAFQGCTGLESFAIPDTVTTIGEYAFKNCTSLNYVVDIMPDDYHWIELGENVFEGCTAIEKFYYFYNYDITTQLREVNQDLKVFFYTEAEPVKRTRDLWSYDALGNLVEWPKTDDNIIHVAYAETGYGREFMLQWKAEFEALYPEYTVQLEGSPTMTAEVETRLQTNSNLPDIFIVLDTGWQKQAVMGRLEPLDDVYAATAYIEDGSSVTIKDFLNPGIRDMGKMPDGHYYTIPWTDGPAGIIYNKTMFEEYGWDQSPDTVEDLMELCDTINAAQIPAGNNYQPYVKPFANYSYYGGFLVDTWWAQYEGVTNYRNFFGYASPEVYKQTGRVEALRAYEYLFFDRDEWLPKNMTFGVSHFVGAQRDFGLGLSAMIVEGAWMQNEAKSFLTDDNGNNKFEYAMMKMPVLTGGATGVSDTSVLASQACDFMCIPKESNTKAGAKLFLQYVNSKKGCESFTKSTGGALRPFQYDAREVEGVNASDFMKSCWDVYYGSNIVYSYSNNPMSWTNELGKWPGIGYPYQGITWGEYIEWENEDDGIEKTDEYGNPIPQAVTVNQKCYGYVTSKWDELYEQVKDYM